MVSPAPSNLPETTEKRYYPAETKAKAKALYLVKFLPPKEIAVKLDVPVERVHDWISNNGWNKIREQRIDRAERQLALDQEKSLDPFMELVAAESEEIALTGFQRARESAASDSEFAAKDFASWTGGVKNLVSMYRTAKGLDAAQASAVNLTLNQFYVPDTAPKPVQSDDTDVQVSPVE